MITFLATSILTCTEALQISIRLSQVIGLNYQQKVEIIKTITEYTPSCPIIIEEDGHFKQK